MTASEYEGWGWIVERMSRALDPALSFDTSTARTYSIIFRTNLLSGAWQGFETNLPGTGGERVVPVTNGALRAFFGVGAWPR